MQKIFKVSLLAVLSSLAVNSFASTAEVKVLEPQLNYHPSDEGAHNSFFQ